MAAAPDLSKRERQIMDVVYAHGEATLSQMLAEMPDPPVRGALRTLVGILERKGHLTRRRQHGREFVYGPTRSRGRAGRSALGRVLDVFFGGSLENAVAAHLSDPRALRPTDEELRRLSDLIEQARHDKGA